MIRVNTRSNTEHLMLPQSTLQSVSSEGRSPLPRLIVIDSQVEDAQLLALGVCEDTRVLLLSPEEDGIEQITQHLWAHPSLRQVSILAHGQPGALVLGSAILSTQTLHRYQRDWDLWSRQLRHLSLFACQVTADEVGRNFLENLYRQTGLAIAASSRPIGSAAKGGTWQLDTHVGASDTQRHNVASPLRPEIQASYGGLLGTLTVNSLADNTISGDGQVTLREAIAAANTDGTTDLGDQASGTDTILFAPSLNDSTISLALGELRVETSIIFNGSTAPGLVISGGGASGVFQFTGGTSTLDSITIADGFATEGAGVHVDNANLTIQNSLLTENTATGDGGTGTGGAIYASNANLTITNTTVTGNRADTGAGMSLTHDTNAVITFSTIAKNQGNGINLSNSNLTIGYTLLADNTRGNIPRSTAQNTNSLGYNLSDDITGGLDESSDNRAVSDEGLQLGTLGRYGGPTQTLAVLPESVAIDGGASAGSSTRDQRGVTRPTNSQVDIGAFEAAIPIVTVNPLATNDASPDLTGTVELPGGVVDETLQISVTIGNGTPLTATNNGDRTWTLPGSVIGTLADGVYDLAVSVSNISGTAIDNTSDELEINTALPTVAVNPLVTNDTTPTLSGTVDPHATVTVTIGDSETQYDAIVEGTTWILSGNRLEAALESGTYAISLTATDSFGNVSMVTEPNALTIDLTPPIVSVDAASLITNDGTPPLTGMVSDPSASVTVTVDGNSYTDEIEVNDEGAWTLPDDIIENRLQAGTYQVVVSATDAAGNTGTVTETLTIDTVPPIVTVKTVKTAAITEENPLQLSGIVTESIQSLTIQLAGEDYEVTDIEGGVWSLTIVPELSEGTYDIRATAIDLAGNEGFDGSINELTVDTTAPTVRIAPIETNDTTPRLRGTLVDTGSEGDVAIALTLRNPGTDFEATYTDNITIDSENGTWQFDVPDSLTDGTYEVVAIATDAVGNVGTDDTESELLIDTTPPTVSIDRLVTNDGTPELTGTVSDINGPVTVTVTVGNDDPYTATVSPDEGTWVLANDSIQTRLTEGTYDIEVEATDRVGNVGTDQTAGELTIDLTPPTATVDSVVTRDTTPALTGTVSEEVATIAVTVNGETYTDTDDEVILDLDTLTWTLPDTAIVELPPNQTYEVQVTVVDLAGNEGFDTTQQELTVDTIAPLVTLEDIAANTPTPTISGTIDDPSARIQVTLGSDIIGEAIIDGDTGETWTLPIEPLLADETYPLEDGTYNLLVTVLDTAGNSSTDTATLIVDTVVPVVAVNELRVNINTPTLTGDISETNATVTVTITNPETSEEKTYEATNNSDNTWSLGLATLEPAGLADGTYEISVLATDTVGNTGTDSSTEELFIDTQAPTVTVNPLETNEKRPVLTGTIDESVEFIQVTVGANTYFDITINGDEDNGYTWELDTLDADLRDGTYDVIVSAADSVNNISSDETTDELFIDATPPTVTVDAVSTNETTITLTGTVEDALSEIESFEVEVNGTSYDRAIIEGTTWTLADVNLADLDDGSYDIAVTATDAQGNIGTDDTTDDLTVDRTAPTVTVDALDTNDNTPTLTGTLDDSTADLQIIVDEEIFPVTAIANNRWEFELPSPLSDGTYTVIATATDPVGNTSDESTGELFIDTVAPQLTIDSLLTNDTRPPFSGTIDDPEAEIQLSVGPQVITATNTGNGTWFVADDVVTTIFPEGTFSFTAIATDRVGNVGIDSTVNEVTIDITAPTASIPEATRTSEGLVEAIALDFSEAITGLDQLDITLTRDGIPVDLMGATLESSNGINWTLGNLTPVTTLTGEYSFTLNAAGTDIADGAGNLLLEGVTTEWSVKNTSVTGLNPPTSINGGQLGSASRISFKGGKRGVKLTGKGSNDRLEGTNDRDRLRGKGGRDKLFGNRNHDRLFGDNGNDRLFGGGGNDRIEGDGGNDRIKGDSGRDRLDGGNGNDRILGGRGSDLIVGGRGSDRLTGNGGSDVFAFENLTDGVDTITDFNTTEDLIDVSGILASPQFAAASPFDKVSQFVRLNQVGSDTEVSIDADGNGDGNSLQQIAILQGVSLDAVVSTNFIA